MSTSQITESDMLWSHRFQLTPGLTAGSDQQSHLFVENSTTGDRFILNRWQMALMAIFDRGDSTVAQAVNEIFPNFPNELDEPTVRQFCEWLINEKLVQDASSHPQLHAVPTPVAPVKDQEPTEPEQANDSDINPIARAVNETQTPKKRRGGFLKRATQLAACIAVGIGTWKFTVEVWPMMKGPLQETKSFVASRVIEKESHSSAVIPPPQRIEIPAGEVVESSLEPDALLKKLRHELLECQTRRDACYRSNDEEGYRDEVHKIAQLTHRIGEIQAEVATEESIEAVEEPVAFGSGS